MSVLQKMRDVDVAQDGSVIHKHLLTKDGLSRRKFKDMQTFENWVSQQM